MMQVVPNASFLPLHQHPPALHPTSAPHLLRKHFPGYATFQNEQDASQNLSIVQPWSPTFDKHGNGWVYFNVEFPIEEIDIETLVAESYQLVALKRMLRAMEQKLKGSREI